MKLNINKIELSYFSHEYNETWSNERYIEVPLGIYFLNKFNFQCVEIGAVMPHYGYIPNVVIDPFDDYKDAIKINALDYSYNNQNVLSISTIEHCKCDEYNNRSNDDSILLLHKIINESKNYLITWPIGYNKHLDNYVQNSNIKRIILRRKNIENEWEIDSNSNNFSYSYNYTFNSILGYKYASAICILTNLSDILE